MRFDVRSAAVGLATGLALGGVLGALYMRHRMERVIDAEVAAIKDHYRARAENSRHDHNAVNGSAPSMGNRNGSESSDDSANDPRLEGFGVEDNEDGELGAEAWPFVAAGRGELEERLSRTGDDDWPPLDRDETNPFIISMEEYDCEHEDYNKIKLKWFAEDNVLLDEDETPIRDFDSVHTGPIKIEDFGGVSKDPHLLYIRNHRLMDDFEITLQKGSWAVLLGYGNPNGA